MAGPIVQTVILNYRTADLTIAAVQAALGAMEGIDGEITVVDNDSGDGSLETIGAAAYAAGWLRGGRVRVVASPRNGGYGAGNNLAIRMGLADGRVPDFVYVLNPDARPDPGAIRALLDALEREPAAGFAGSAIRGPDGEPHQTAFRYPTVFSEFEGAARLGPVSRLLADYVVALPMPTRTCAVDWLAGASLLMRRQVLEEIGLFDEGFFLYFEETDLCRRARRAGWSTIYVPESRVAHEGSASTGMKRWRRTPQYWFDSRLRYFVKNHGAPYAVAATVAHVLGGLIWRARRAMQGKPSADPAFFLRDLTLHALRAGLRGLKPARPSQGRASQPPTSPSPSQWNKA